jgi:hypothetical protein
MVRIYLNQHIRSCYLGRIRVIRVWRIRVPWNISKSSQKAVRIRVIRVWRIRVPWNISKSSHKKLLGLG